MMFAILIGTRPEAIKMRSIVSELRKCQTPFRVIYTGQQLNLENSFFSELDIPIDSKLSNRERFETISEECSRQISGLNLEFLNSKYTGVFVQGDTTTALAGALTAAMLKIPVFHIEAGLRTFDPLSPFPEELNRRMISALSTLNFAPTQKSGENLIAEGVSKKTIHVVGNTVVDSLRMSIPLISPLFEKSRQRSEEIRIFVSCHRRELTDNERKALAESVVRLCDSNTNIQIDFSLHSNPLFSSQFRKILGDNPQIFLHEGLSYLATLQFLSVSNLVITDSGGLQEESATLGIPLLVYREKTERPECVQVSNSMLLKPRDNQFDDILRAFIDQNSRKNFSLEFRNVVGDGYSAEKIVDIVKEYLP